MKIKVHRYNAPAELVVRFPGGEEQPAELNDLVPALWRAGYLVLCFSPGGHVETYTPRWLMNACEKWDRDGRPEEDGAVRTT